MNKLILFTGLLLTTWLAACNKNKIENPVRVTPPDPSQFGIKSITPVYKDVCNVHFSVDSIVTLDYNQIELIWGEDPSLHKHESIVLDDGQIKTLDSTIQFTNLRGPSTYYFKLRLSAKNNKSVFETEAKSFEVTPLSVALAGPDFKKGDTNYMVKIDYDPCLEKDTAVAIYLNKDIQLKTYGFYCMGLYAYVPDSLPSGKYSMTVRVHNMTVDAGDIEILNGYWKMITPPVIPKGYYNGMNNGYGNYSVCGDFASKTYLIGGYLWMPVNDVWEMDINTDYFYTRPGFIWAFDVPTHSWHKKQMKTIKYFDFITTQYYNNSIYVISGLEATKHNGFIDYVNSPLRLDLNTMDWQKMAPAPYEGVSNQVSTQMNNEFYVGLGKQQIGDWDIHIFNEFWKYNPLNDQWTRLADFPGERSDANGLNVTMVTMGGNIYLYKGDTKSYNPSTTLWKYTTTENTWTSVQLPPLDILPFGEKYAIAVREDKLLFFTTQQALFGAQGNYVQTNSAGLEFDPETGQYTKFSGPPILDIMQLIGQKDDIFYFQSDQRGYNDGIWDNTYAFHYQDN